MRLIDVDALWTQMKEYYEIRAEEANMTDDRVVCVTWHDAVILIKNAPIIEAEPVKHGRWLPSKDGHGCECSECGTPYGWIEADTMRYCKRCGARMDDIYSSWNVY